ncbi:MAG: SH3 domain-containing protein [Cyanobacteria bacterium P01_G01_bin.4]
MFQTPPPPPFLSETPLGRSPTASSDNSGAATDLGSDNSSSDVAASSDGAGNADEAVESGTPASSPESTSETSDAIAVEPSVSNSPALDSNPPVPEPVANSTTRGRVSEPIGLAMRADPSIEAAYLGGLAFNETVTILESSGDGTWQRVRRDFNGLEGWIKAGNIEEITE